MQPRPIADTSGPSRPKRRVRIVCLHQVEPESVTPRPMSVPWPGICGVLRSFSRAWQLPIGRLRSDASCEKPAQPIDALLQPAEVRSETPADEALAFRTEGAAGRESQRRAVHETFAEREAV